MFEVRSLKIVFNVEQSEKGKVVNAKEIPVVIYEAAFDTTLEALVKQLIEQVSGSPESAAADEEQKEE